jgi:DNA-directed RNA polymerase specialized sigma subunit
MAKSITPARALEILPLVRQGNRDAMDEMIIGHMNLAWTIAQGYPDKDESVSLAYCGLVDGVRLISTGHLKHDNVSAYLSTRIRGEILDSLREKTMPNLLICDRCVQTDNSLELEETILALSQDSVDELIIRKLLFGDLAVDIARVLGMHQSTIGRRIKRIQDAYTAELNS